MSDRLRYDLVDEPKAGIFGVFSVLVFGVLYILVAFAALYMWFDADFGLAAASAVGLIVVPMTVGFFVSELVHQRAGALWFVLTAALLTGAMGAWAVGEADDFNARQRIFSPAPSSSSGS